MDNNKLLSVFYSEQVVDSSIDFIRYSNRSKHTHPQTANIQGNPIIIYFDSAREPQSKLTILGTHSKLPQHKMPEEAFLQ